MSEAKPTGALLSYAMREMLRSMITERGGSFHGPRVETLSMPETDLWKFLGEVLEMANGR